MGGITETGGVTTFISTKGRYALRMMQQLAENTDRPVRIKEVAETQDISAKYLEQIMIVLKSAGFVESTRGPKGGYRLAKPPEEYTVGSIIREMEGEISIPCVKGKSAHCSRYENCTAIKLWSMVDEAVSGVIDHVTLADLVRWGEECRNGQPVRVQ